MLCLGAPGLGTPCCGSSGVRGLKDRYSAFWKSAARQTLTIWKRKNNSILN